MAKDIHDLVAALQLGPQVNVFGHDMGGMVAYAYAAQFRDQVLTLSILDVPLPGIEPLQYLLKSDRVWHFRFFGNRDVAESLIVDREKVFLSWFHNSEAVNAGAFTDEVWKTSMPANTPLRAQCAVDSNITERFPRT
ncbi:alpha/beta fold hydrolase [Duganella sp. LjRoot269]|uniref:alpha/beta fold hydrolase n=1 Tax=Duganella sp. LjRoot269 TaxID=3342305 RepID=UPI003ECF732F